MEIRDILIYLYLKYNGNNKKLFNALQEKELVSESDLAVAKKEHDFSKFYTCVDKDYPKDLKGFEYGAFPLVIRKDYDILCSRIASYIYAKAVLNSFEGSYSVTFEEIEKRFELTEKLADNGLVEIIVKELELYEGIDGGSIWVTDKDFDIYVYGAYLAQAIDDSEEE